MSNWTGTWTELLYANTADFNQVSFSGSASEASLLGGANGMQPTIPAFFCGTGLQQATGKALRLVGRGVVGANSTNPTFTWFIRMGTTINVITGTSIGQSAAITMGSSAATTTTVPFRFELDFVIRTPGMGSANCTLFTSGTIWSPAFAAQAAPLNTSEYLLSQANNATTWTTTFDPTQAQYINVSVSGSATSANNLITLKELMFYGLN